MVSLATFLLSFDMPNDLPPKKPFLKKLTDVGSRKLPIAPTELATVLAGSIGISAGLTLADTALEKNQAKGAVDALAIVQSAAKDDAGPKTLAAIQAEEIKATSAILQANKGEDLLGALTLAGGVGAAGFGALSAANRLGRKEKKPGEANQAGPDQPKVR